MTKNTQVIKISGARMRRMSSTQRRRTAGQAIFNNFIRIRGARVHNLKNINVDIPKNKLVVITGLSGSGKSSLAFDTLYAEAERRFVESLSSYARQFLGVSDKPDIDAIEGLSPAISIDQKSVAKNPRSTVGTITEIYDYLRILFARIGKPHCPECGKPVGRQSVDMITDTIMAIRGRELMILGPVISGKKGEHRLLLEEIRDAGFLRVRIDGTVFRIEEAFEAVLDKKKKHSLEAVVDRFLMTGDIERSRIADSVETALKIGKGFAVVADSRDPKLDVIFSEQFACASCGINLPEIEPRLFSFNSPYGACPECTGLGSTLEVDSARVIPNKNLSIAEGAIRPWVGASHRVGRQSWYWWLLENFSARCGFSLRVPVKELPSQIIDQILYGEINESSANQPYPISDNRKKISKNQEESHFEGVVPNLKRRWKETDSEWTRAEIEKYMVIRSCGSCGGSRLKKEARGVLINGQSIVDVSRLSIVDAKIFFSGLFEGKSLTAVERKIATGIIKEIIQRLRFLTDVGLDYLSLDRESTTLAGGESQRIRLATQIGSRLTGITYILDEPSIGLHPRDHGRLIHTLKQLRDLGNTVIVVEHDAETMREADWIIDLGPGAGKHGGKVMFSGRYRDLLKTKTLTGDYLARRKTVKIPNHKSQNKFQVPRLRQCFVGQASSKLLLIQGAREHNLKNIEVKIPLEKFVCVTGVSGSGKSTLVNDVLAKALRKKFFHAHVIPGAHKKILGIENLDKAIVVDQSPIGRTPRSNPATYTGAFTVIRQLFSQTKEARVRGYAPGRFSFNVKGGRCEACEGQGVKKIEMYFLPDVYVACEECRARRYNREALDIAYKGLDIAQVLDLTIDEANGFFAHIPAIADRMKTLVAVGLGYMKLGQSCTTLSGGEAQRIKLASELSRRDTGKTLYILDEPTTGLHFDDINRLLMVLHLLVERGNTVLVIEHNLDVIRNADWIIDLGPEGGDGGGRVVAEGTPVEVMRVAASYTGQWLRMIGTSATRRRKPL